jgi:GNAT superfamily N-acetyltransferase
MPWPPHDAWLPDDRPDHAVAHNVAVNSPGEGLTIREATPADVPGILAMVRELAEYERALDDVVATEAHLQRTLFADVPAVFGHVAETPGGQLAGMAVWFLSYSTWRGTHSLYLEDLFVRPEHRGTGVGQLLLQTLAAICLERGYERLEWWVLDWNESARGFYASIGAEALTEWIPYRVTGDALARLAGRA